MGLETATYIDSLVETNPTGSDDRSTADDHLRLIKASLKRTFANINGEVRATPANLNFLTAVAEDVQAKLDALSVSAAAIASRVASMSASVVAVEASVAALNSQVSSLSATFTVRTNQLSASIAAAESHVNAVSAAQATTSANLTTEVNNRASLSANFTTKTNQLSASIAAAESHINAVSASLDATSATLRAKDDQLQASISDIQNVQLPKKLDTGTGGIVRGPLAVDYSNAQLKVRGSAAGDTVMTGLQRSDGTWAIAMKHTGSTDTTELLAYSTNGTTIVSRLVLRKDGGLNAPMGVVSSSLDLATKEYVDNITAFRGALVYRATSFVIPSATPTLLPFDAEDYDTDSIHSATNSSRLTVPSGVSRVVLKCKVTFPSTAGSVRRLEITQSGGTYIGQPVAVANPTQQVDETILYCETPVLRVLGGEYFEVYVFHGDDTSINLVGDGVGYSHWFSMEILE